jgi:hypothetical protein
MAVARAVHVRRLLIAVGLAGCEGVLHEKPAGLALDAGALAQVQTPPCDPPAAPPGDGHHNPGEDCLMCHHQGGMDGAPPFTFAGTLFDSSGGSAPVAGATIHLIDALGTDVIVQTESNGNFYSLDLVTYPVLAFSSLCPNVTPMITPLGEADGSCNSAGCHTAGFRMH